MSSQTNETALYKAVRDCRIETIRELLYENKCDPHIVDMNGRTAAFMFFLNLLVKGNINGSDACLTTNEIACFTDLLWFTYDTQVAMVNERMEVFDMMDYCFQFVDAHIYGKLYMEIVNVFITPFHHRRYFVENIRRENLHSDHCLIASLFPMNELLVDINFISLRSNFLSEALTLFIANESFFGEYISEVMSTGWTLKMEDQSEAFCRTIYAINPTIPMLFNFMKYVIQYEIGFSDLLFFCSFDDLDQIMCADIISNVFVPLSNFRNVSIDLARLLGQGKPNKLAYYNFDETGYLPDDFNVFVDKIQNKKVKNCNFNQVVSLQNLARMTIRKYYFKKYSHYKALSLLYSLNVPIIIRKFLCYNKCNLKF